MMAVTVEKQALVELSQQLKEQARKVAHLNESYSWEWKEEGEHLGDIDHSLRDLTVLNKLLTSSSIQDTSATPEGLQQSFWAIQTYLDSTKDLAGRLFEHLSVANPSADNPQKAREELKILVTQVEGALRTSAASPAEAQPTAFAAAQPNTSPQEQGQLGIIVPQVIPYLQSKFSLVSYTPILPQPIDARLPIYTAEVRTKLTSSIVLSSRTVTTGDVTATLLGLKDATSTVTEAELITILSNPAHVNTLLQDWKTANTKTLKKFRDQLKTSGNDTRATIAQVFYYRDLLFRFQYKLSTKLAQIIQ